MKLRNLLSASVKRNDVWADAPQRSLFRPLAIAGIILLLADLFTVWLFWR